MRLPLPGFGNVSATIKTIYKLISTLYMNIESARNYCLSKIGVTEDQAFGDDYILFRIANKIFACIDLKRPDLIVLKCQPGQAIALRDKYNGICGAWHWNKRHWNEVYFNSDVEDDVVLQLIDDAYELVINGLPQKLLYRIQGLPRDWYHEHHPQCDSVLNIIKQPQLRNKKQRFVLVTTDYQTAGRGQGTNTWEAEDGKNLLFALRIQAPNIPAEQQFYISSFISLAVVKALQRFTGLQRLSIKWPNDIYVDDKKIAGILIEHTLRGKNIKETIVGVGININQTIFTGDAPNPISIAQVKGKEVDRGVVLRGFILAIIDLLPCLNKEDAFIFSFQSGIHCYRRNGFHPFRDANGTFQAEIHNILSNGQIQLRDENGRIRTYSHKEVEFVI